MLTKTLLALSLLTGTVVLANYSQDSNIQIVNTNLPQTVTQLPTTDIENIAREITVWVNAGDNRSSGILIAKNNDTYTVVTNVVSDGSDYIIQTPDGIEHTATAINSTQNALVVLEFNSSNNYQVATIGNSDSITEGETVIAAGFSESEGELVVTEGSISLVTQKPLQKGYSIGLTNETVQGMIGGALLNSNGEVVAVLGKGKDAILDTAYDYSDGTTPTPEEIAAYRQVSFSIPIANIANLSPQLAQLVPGSNPDIAQQPEAEAPTPQPEYTGIVKTVDDIAKQITVRIATPDISSFGSGAIIARNGNTYYVAAARHVVQDKKQFQVITPDGATYELDNNTIAESDAYDFAIFSFTSDKDYTVATVGNYTVGANDEQVVFVSGFPGNSSPNRAITGGKVTPRDRTNFRTKDANSFLSITPDSPGLLYTNISYKGMSGGAVLDSEGRLVGINTAAENEIYLEGNFEEFSLGYSLGVPIQDVFTFLEQNQLQTAWLQKTDTPAAKVEDNEWEAIKAQLLDIDRPNDNTLVAWMNYGNQLWRYEQYDEAVEAFERVIEIDPNFDKAYYAMGLSYRDREDYPQAVTAFIKATETNPNPYYYWRYLGFSYRELQQFDDALAAYELAIAKSPEDFVLYIEHGDVLRENQQDRPALQSYNKALQINPNHPWGYNNRGTAYDNLTQYDKAIADYNSALELNPQDASAYTNLGVTYNKLEQYDNAIASLDRAITLDSQLVDAYNSRGLAYKYLKQYDRAFADYDKATSLDAEYAFAYNNRGNAYKDLKQYDKAIAQYDKAIFADPEFALAYNNRGTVYDDLAQYDNALADYEQSIVLDPRLVLPYGNRGVTYYNLGQYDEALADFEKAIAIDVQYVEAYNNRALVYQELQQYDRAIEDFGRAIAIDPQIAEPYNNRGALYQETEQYEPALADFTSAIALNSEYAEAYYNRGVTYNRLGEYDLALADFNQALAIDPQLADAYLGRGITYSQLEDTRAIDDWKQAANLFEQQNQPEKAQKIRELLQQL